MTENRLKKSKPIKRVTAIGKLAGQIAAPVLGKRGFAEVDILTKWEEIVGAELAAHISPVKISFQKNKKDSGTLHVRTAGSAYATELQHKTPRVIERINAYFGYQAVKFLKIQQGSLSKKQYKKQVAKPVIDKEEEAHIEEVVNGLENDELKNALASLGRAVAINKKNAVKNRDS